MTASAEPTEKRAAEDVATKAGRGTLFITASKLWFMLTGAALYFILPRMIPPASLGVYKVVIGLVSVVNAVVVTGTIQTVSKFVSATPDRADAIKRKALLLQFVLGGGAAVAFAAAAPLVAAALNDASLTPYLRLAALITASYGFYAVFVGVLNGRKEFFKQASIDAFYSTAKVVLIVLFTAAMGFSLVGSIAGFAAAAFVALVVGALAVGVRGRAADSPVGFGNLLQFQVALIVFLLVNNLLMKTDLLIVKATISADPTAASEAAGVYGAALDFAYIVFQIIVSLTFVIFPIVSEAAFADNLGAVRGYVRETLRATLAICVLPAVIFSANAAEVLHVVYPPAYAAGAPALRIVALGMLSFAVITVLASVISSAGKPWVSVSIVALTIVIDAALNLALVPRYGLVGAAIGTTIAMAAGAVAALAVVWKQFGATLSAASVLRVAVAGGIVYAIALVVPIERIAGALEGGVLPKLAVGLECAVLGIVYLVLLVAVREIGRTELNLAKRIAGIQ